MEGIPLDKYCMVVGALANICSVILAGATLKFQASTQPKSPQNRRYGFFASFILLFFGGSLIGTGALLKSPAGATPNREISQPNSCPCPDASKPEEKPSLKAESAAPKSSATPTTVDAQGLHFLVDNRRIDYSPNALMGKFEGSIIVGTDGITLFMPNPVLKLAGSTTNWGDRDVVSIQAAIDEYGDLSKISKSSKMKGDAAWSEPFELKGVVCSNGENCTIQQTVKLFIPGQFSNLSQKALLIKINNKFAGSRNEIFPGYVLSDRNIFSSR